MKKFISITMCILMVCFLASCKKKDEINKTADEVNASDTVQGKLSGMTLDEKIYQMLFVAPEALAGESDAAGGKTEEVLRAKPVGGIILFGNNIKNKKQLTEMTGNLQSFSKVPLFIGVDEEGGDVARLANNGELGTTKFSPPAEMKNGQAVYDAYKTIATEIKGFGINVNFAPVADVLTNENNTEIGKRSFGKNADDVAEKTASAVTGLHDGGVVAVLKHFPGIGSTENDSHAGKSTSQRTLEELRNCELKPFRTGIEKGAEFVLVSHMSLKKVTGSDIPATMSSKIMKDILRNELGFSGIIITDSFSMKAVTNYYSPGSAAVNAVLAGADMILMPENLDDAVDSIKGAIASGRISEDRINESVERILNVKAQRGLM